MHIVHRKQCWEYSLTMYTNIIQHYTHISGQIHCEVFDNLSLSEWSFRLAIKILDPCYHPKIQEDQLFFLKYSKMGVNYYQWTIIIFVIIASIICFGEKKQFDCLRTSQGFSPLPQGFSPGFFPMGNTEFLLPYEAVTRAVWVLNLVSSN